MPVRREIATEGESPPALDRLELLDGFTSESARKVFDYQAGRGGLGELGREELRGLIQRPAAAALAHAAE